jgi:hypothetical protein
LAIPGEDVAFDYRNNPILGPALAYWERKRGGHAMPTRAQIDPAEIAPLLRNLQLIDVVDGGRRFRYRLVGTAIVTAFGREYTGKWLDELFPSERGKFAKEIYQLTCRERLPVFARSTYVTATGRELVANRLCMPLSPDGTSVTMIMGALIFESSLRPIAGVWEQARMLEARWAEVIRPSDAVADAPGDRRRTARGR